MGLMHAHAHAHVQSHADVHAREQARLRLSRGQCRAMLQLRDRWLSRRHAARLQIASLPIQMQSYLQHQPVSSPRKHGHRSVCAWELHGASLLAMATVGPD